MVSHSCTDPSSAAGAAEPALVEAPLGDELPNADSADQTPSFMLGRVAEVTQDALLLAIAGESHAARQAASCLLSPQRGDVVLCAGTRLGIHVLHVLERESSDHANVSVPGARRMVLEQPALVLHAEELEATATRARAHVDRLHLLSRAVSVVAGGLDLVAGRLKRVAGLETTSVRDSVRAVRNTDTVRAAHVLHEATEVMSLRSGGVTLVEARGDVRVNGERISMG